MSQKTFLSLSALLVFVLTIAVLFSVRIMRPENLLGRILEGDDLLRVQVESDFDRDGDVDFLDFTVFSAFYEEKV